jgi:hypothetical protein
VHRIDAVIVIGGVEQHRRVPGRAHVDRAAIR